MPRRRARRVVIRLGRPHISNVAAGRGHRRRRPPPAGRTPLTKGRCMERPHHYYRRLRHAPRLLRIFLGMALIVAGVFGFLPVLGFWMIPLGLAVIFLDAPLVRRSWSRLRSWWKLKRGRRDGAMRP